MAGQVPRTSLSTFTASTLLDPRLDCTVDVWRRGRRRSSGYRTVTHHGAARRAVRSNGDTRTRASIFIEARAVSICIELAISTPWSLRLAPPMGIVDPSMLTSLDQPKRFPVHGILSTQQQRIYTYSSTIQRHGKGERTK